MGCPLKIDVSFPCDKRITKEGKEGREEMRRVENLY